MDDGARLVSMTREEAEALIKDLPPLEDPVTKWKREADEQEARFAAAREAREKRWRREPEQAAAAASAADLDARFEQWSAILMKASGEALSDYCRELRREIRRELEAKFKAELSELRGYVEGRFSAIEPKR
jgi:hypothetical protein